MGLGVVRNNTRHRGTAQVYLQTNPRMGDSLQYPRWHIKTEGIPTGAYFLTGRLDGKVLGTEKVVFKKKALVCAPPRVMCE